MNEVFAPPITDAMNVLKSRLDALELRLAAMQAGGIPYKHLYREVAAEWLMVRAALEIGAVIEDRMKGEI